MKPKVFVTPIVMLLNILKRNKCPSQSLFFNRGMQTELFHSIATIAYFIRLTLVSGLVVSLLHRGQWPPVRQSDTGLIVSL